jgi:tRNA A-37 threonylcarbamoyl transferase component Bud32
VDPAAAINGAPVVLKRSRSSTVVLHGSDSVLKAFHPRRIASRLGNLWRGTRARRAFRQGHRLELLGIPTPRVLAFADGHQSLFASRSWLITELVPEATHATAFLASVTDPSRTDRFLRDVGALVGRLHRSGLAHRDLKGRNILRTVDDHAILVDLDGLKDQGCVSRAVQRRDLARLFRSAREVPQLEPRKARVFLRSYVRTLKWQDLGAAVALEGASLVDRPKGEHAYR